VAITDSNASLEQVIDNARQVQNRPPDDALWRLNACARI
jgi:hypothetical protein